MATRGTINLRTAALGLGVVIAVAAAVIFFGFANDWWRGQQSASAEPPGEQAASHDLVRDASGRPVPHPREPAAARLCSSLRGRTGVTAWIRLVRRSGPHRYAHRPSCSWSARVTAGQRMLT